LAFFFCHPEPGPELNSGSNDFGISVLGLENLGFKAPPFGRGNLLKLEEALFNTIKRPEVGKVNWRYIEE